MKLTDREIELIDGMIEVQEFHAQRCRIMIETPGRNTEMAKKQFDNDMERVELLRKIKREGIEG